MTDRLKQIVEKYTLKETDGFEGKKDKETNVEEDLRKNYETGKMVPYQSVIAEGKIIVNKKKTLKEEKKESEQFEELMELAGEMFGEAAMKHLDRDKDAESNIKSYILSQVLSKMGRQAKEKLLNELNEKGYFGEEEDED